MKILFKIWYGKTIIKIIICFCNYNNVIITIYIIYIVFLFLNFNKILRLIK